MARFLKLRDDGGFALALREGNLRGQTMPSTSVRGSAEVRATLAPGLRQIAPRLASSLAVGGAKISEILIGCAAIRNRCNSLKVKGGDHF
jgi:hypothetical protein